MEQLFKRINVMNVQDLRIAFFNAISLGISFTAVENSLKIILLLASIIYTFQKIYETHKKKNEKNS
jgi:hypothetical protein